MPRPKSSGVPLFIAELRAIQAAVDEPAVAAYQKWENAVLTRFRDSYLRSHEAILAQARLCAEPDVERLINNRWGYQSDRYSFQLYLYDDKPLIIRLDANIGVDPSAANGRIAAAILRDYGVKAECDVVRLRAPAPARPQCPRRGMLRPEPKGVDNGRGPPASCTITW